MASESKAAPKPVLAALLLQPGSAKAIIENTDLTVEGDVSTLDRLASVLDIFNPHFNLAVP